MTWRQGWIALAITLLALVFVAGVLVWTAPADVAYRVLRSRLGGWQAQGLSGSLWEGRAAQVAVHGVPLGALQWKVSRPAFFSGTTRGSAILEDQRNRIALDLHFERRGRTATLRDLTLVMPAQMLAPALSLPGLVPLGVVEARLPEVSLVDGHLARVTGSVEWREMGVSGAAEGSLGDIEAAFDAAPDGAVLLVVRDRNARIGVNGRVRFSGPEFDMEVTLTPRESSLQIFEVLRLIGQRTADGGTLLRVNGRMQPLY